MNRIVLLLTVSALSGLLFGLYFRVVAIVISSGIFALLAAMVLQNEGFGFVAGIAMIVVSLTVHQLAYLIGAMLVARHLKDK